MIRLNLISIQSMKLFNQSIDSHMVPTRLASNRTLQSRDKRWRYCLAASLALTCVTSWAQTTAMAEGSATRSGGFVGLGLDFSPRYQGADESKTIGVPGFEYHWANGLFAGGTKGLLGFQLHSAPTLQFGVALGLDEGRMASESRYLIGMGDVAARGTLNLHANAAISDKFELSARLRVGSGNSAQGKLINLGASYGFLSASTTRMSFNVEAVFANTDYMQDYFGVSSEQAGTSGYKRYSPVSGLRDVTVGLDLQHDVSKEWMLFASLNSTTLSNIARESPLVRKANYNSAVAGIAYSF